MCPDENVTNLIVTGVGGQGNVLAARLLASVALAEGYEVTVGDVYGLTQRGGSVASHVRWTKGNPLPPLVPQHGLDILLAFEPLEALRVLTQFGHEDTRGIVNMTPIVPIGVQTGRFEYPEASRLSDALRGLTRTLRLVDATAVARRLGNIQVLNMVMLGALFASGFITLRDKVFEDTIVSTVAPKHLPINQAAFRAGLGMVNPNPRHHLTGSEGP
jgi:indolepyruvate ferredoxin oxidoreductase beta subunit